MHIIIDFILLVLVLFLIIGAFAISKSKHRAYHRAEVVKRSGELWTSFIEKSFLGFVSLGFALLYILLFDYLVKIRYIPSTSLLFLVFPICFLIGIIIIIKNAIWYYKEKKKSTKNKEI